MILIIDTSDPKFVFIALSSPDGKVLGRKRFRAQYQQAEKLLPAIATLAHAIKPKQPIGGIIVVSGPGPFTALRIGVTVANTIAWAKRVAIVEVSKTQFSSEDELIAVGIAKLNKARSVRIIEPRYGQEPNITIGKK